MHHSKSEERNSRSMEKILGVDYGDVRTGIAVTDALGMMAHGLETVVETNYKELARRVIAIAASEGVTMIVVGIPVNMDGSEGPRAEKTRRFVEALRKRTELPVDTMDERCTTMAAERFMNETDTRGKKRREVIDTLAAEIILQNYLERRK